MNKPKKVCIGCPDRFDNCMTKAECQERVERILKETGEELERWMEEEASSYRRIAQVEHAIIKLKKGQTLKEGVK